MRGTIRSLLTTAEVMSIFGVRSRQVVSRAVVHGFVGAHGARVRLAAVETPGGRRFCESDVRAYLVALTDARLGTRRARTAIDEPVMGPVMGSGAARLDAAYPPSRRPRRAVDAAGGVAAGGGAACVRHVAAGGAR